MWQAHAVCRPPRHTACACYIESLARGRRFHCRSQLPNQAGTGPILSNRAATRQPTAAPTSTSLG